MSFFRVVLKIEPKYGVASLLFKLILNSKRYLEYGTIDFCPQ